MMFKKRVMSLIIAVVLLMSMAIVPTTFTATEVIASEVTVNSSEDYNLTGDIQTGNILHAFNWRMSDLVKYAPEIAAAGYSSVQISPIQKTKPTVNDGSYATDWWSFYQPNDFTIGNALGTEEDLVEAIDTLHSYGIKVVADVVTNHLQSNENKADWSALPANIRAFARKNSSTSTTYIDSTRVGQTTTDMGGLKDINTEKEEYQNYVLSNLLIPLLNDGIDGFRFDAAKHIATPSDSSCQSQYWPNVTGAIRENDPDVYIYGEVLSLQGQGSITGYTEYMNVTDYAYGNTVRNALNSKNASNLTNYGWANTSKNQNVLWVESHDNFCDLTSTSLTKTQQILGWAIVGSRADAPALFFVRPKHEQLDSAGFIKYDELMGAPGAADTWKDATVVAVNKFKNAFAGQSETDYASGSNFFVQRGKTGMVIVNLNGKSTSISQSCSMTGGTYKDQVSGNTFTVSGGKISGTVGSTGVAVIYNTDADNSVPSISLKLNGTVLTPEVLSRYTTNNATIDVVLSNATSGTVKVSNLDAVEISGGTTTFKLLSSIPYGKSVDITVTATNGSKNVSRSYNVKKKNANETKRVYFDNSVMKWPVSKTDGAHIYVYCKTGIAPSTQIAAYDAYQMKLLPGTTDIYYYDVPADTKYVKFNEGYIGAEYFDKAHKDEFGRCHLMHGYNECGGYCGRTMPETVVNYGTANVAANRENGGYLLEGSMILTNLRFEDYGEYPAAVLSKDDVTLFPGEQPTEAPTEAPTTPVDPGTMILRGDADNDNEVTILDATAIQRVLALLAVHSYNAKAAEVDGDKEVSILDATAIQRYLAELGDPYGINTYIDAEPDEPTEAPTVAPTDVQIITQPLPNKFVAQVYCENAGTNDETRNSVHDFDTATGTLTYDFVGPSYVFVRNYDTGIQYCTDGWSYFANPVTLVNEHNLTNTFDKMYVPAGTHTLYLTYNSSNDTCTLGYTDSSVIFSPTSASNPTQSSDPTDAVSSSITFVPGAADNGSVKWYAWVWNNGSSGTWISGTRSGSSTIVFQNAASYDNIVVASMPADSANADWNKCVNQSEDTAVQSGKSLAFKSWSSGKKFNIEWR